MNDYLKRHYLLEKYQRYIRRFTFMWDTDKVHWKRRIRLFTIEIILWLLKRYYFAAKPLFKKSEEKETDVVVISAVQIDIDRSMNVWKIMENKGFIIQYLVENTSLYLTAIGRKLEVDSRISSHIFLEALIAQYIVETFKPKMICLFHPNKTLPSLVRICKGVGAKSVFIPHAVTSQMPNYSSFDFDYYLAYGQSSVENIKRNPLRIGSTKVVKTGSTLISPDMKYTLPKRTDAFVYFSSWDIGRDPSATKNFMLVKEYASQHPEYDIFVKLHPLEDEKFVTHEVKSIANMRVLEKSVSLRDAIVDFPLVIATATNASIEAALMGRPTVIINCRDYNEASSNSVLESDRYLCLEQYFPPRARNTEELHERILEVLDKHNFYLTRCKDFVKYHYERTTDSVEYTASVLNQIIQDEENFPYIEIEEKVPPFLL